MNASFIACMSINIEKHEKHEFYFYCPLTSKNTNFHEFFRNCDIDIDVSSCKGSFCLFLFLFFPHLQVFLWSCAFPNCHSARPFLFLLFLFIQRSDFFIIFFFITHNIVYTIYNLYWFVKFVPICEICTVAICEICTDLYDLTFASHVDRWFCPTGHTFIVAFGEGFF